MLAYLYAAERSEKVAGVAVVMGAIGSRIEPDRQMRTIPTPQAPVPLVIVHGDADDNVPYAGGTSMRRPSVAWASVYDAVSLWRETNHAETEAATETLYGGRVSHSTWRAQAGGAPIDLYTIHDGRHRWPAGRKREDFDAARVIWQHFVGGS